jgi:hypothetical protein
MIFGNLLNKLTGTRNIEILTEAFVTVHNSICESLTKDLNEVLANNPPTFKAASRFEVGMYLLFRLDHQLCNKQKDDIRAKLLNSCTETLVPSDESRFWDIVNYRLKQYGKIFNETKGSGGTWGDVWIGCIDYLINAIYYCGDKYEKMTTEIMPLDFDRDFLEWFFLKSILVSCESSFVAMFCCALKNVFSGNDNFTLLSQKEIIKRMRSGFKEGLLISKSIKENQYQIKKT